MNNLILNQASTIYRALTWGNCYSHYCQARAGGPWSARVTHALMAFMELPPIVGQIVSLFEVAMGYLRPSPSFVSLLDPKLSNIDEILAPLARQIEKPYIHLPWPKSIQKVVIYTYAQGDYGDIAGAAKLIDRMATIDPGLTFDWVVKGYDFETNPKPESFLKNVDSSKINIREWGSVATDNSPAQLLLMGITKCTEDKAYIEKGIGREIQGPVLNVLENASFIPDFSPQGLQWKIDHDKNSFLTIPQKIYSILFKGLWEQTRGFLPMGLKPGTGILLDQDRIKAPLSQRYCCPSYLLKIENPKLRKDILQSMEIEDNQTEPDYSRYSFNFGYAHYKISLGKFIDFVALHEREKEVVILLKDKSKDFEHQIFTQERLDFLRKSGYGDIILKREGSQKILAAPEDSKAKRRLTVIVDSSFASNHDIKCMQLAAERILSTGDNSAAESWCARCKLFLYEDRAQGSGCKDRFLQQQVDLAQTISPTLSRLLALFGGDKRIRGNPLNEPLDQQRMDEIEELLKDPHLNEATFQFCQQITQNYSFDEIFMGALKRAVWHSVAPELMQKEAAAFNQGSFNKLAAYLNGEKVSFEQEMQTLESHVKETLQNHLPLN